MDHYMDYALNNTSNYSNLTQKIVRGRTNVELFVGTSTFLIIIFMTLAGNFLVILSIFTYKPLNKVQNYFLVSLAAADLCVAALVMPFHVIKFWMGGKWALGAALCQLWLTCDILSCTASILNLCVIALDRYWAITSPISYSNRRTMKFVLAMIAALWILSILISVPPLVGWNDWQSLSAMESTCQLTEETGFVVFSASGSFFVPLIVMTVVYVKIFAAARQRLRSKRYHSLRQYSQGLKGAGDAGAENEEDDDSGRNIRKQLRKFSAFATKDVPFGRLWRSSRSLLRTQSSMKFGGKHALPIDVRRKRLSSLPEERYAVPLPEGALCPATSEKDVKSLKKFEKSRIPESPLTVMRKNGTKNLIVSNKLIKGTKSREHRSLDNKLSNTANGNPYSRICPRSLAASAPVTELFARMYTGRPPRSNVPLISAPALESPGVNRAVPAPAFDPPPIAQSHISQQSANIRRMIKDRERISVSREKKAAKTLAIIMGVFVLCWLPFFLQYILKPFCHLGLHPKVEEIITWLGYINSALNPIIYTIFNMDFRLAFQRILCRWNRKKST